MIFKLNVLLIILISLCACHDKTASRSDPDSIPNANTRYITFNTLDVNDATNLLDNFEKRLQKDHFIFTKTSQNGKTSFTNCDNNTIMIIDGEGILRYQIESTVAEKGSMKNTYARFTLSVFTFENEAVAAKNHKLIEEALQTSSSEAYCNGKGAWTILQKDNRVYYFFPGANMFETHTVKYANYIKNFQP
jgi:hypothetical protein